MQNESMVYLNKVFSDLTVRSCPLLSDFTANAETFTQQLSFCESSCRSNTCTDTCGCGCGCSSGCGCGLDFSEDLTFVVDNTQVIISAFDLADPAALTAASVTVNGIPVDDLEFFNNRFMASTTALMAQVGNCKCMERGQSTKGFLLIQNAGTWLARLTVIVNGTVSGCGGCKPFKLVLSSREGVPVAIPGTSTFAASNLCLPCTTDGISPVINFSFSGSAALLNPVITTDVASESCNVILTGSLVTEPIANIQVTRQTLFATSAFMIEQPCDGMPEPCPRTPINPCCNDGRVSEFCGCVNDGAVSDACGGTDPNNSGNDCGCGCGCISAEPACPAPEPVKPAAPRRPQIACQWNGCNGCY